jgi:hypothetical protein
MAALAFGQVVADRVEVLDGPLDPLVTTIARASPPILFNASTCSWKWSTMISALSRMASWLST